MNVNKHLSRPHPTRLQFAATALFRSSAAPCVATLRRLRLLLALSLCNARNHKPKGPICNFQRGPGNSELCTREHVPLVVVPPPSALPQAAAFDPSTKTALPRSSTLIATSTLGAFTVQPDATVTSPLPPNAPFAFCGRARLCRSLAAIVDPLVHLVAEFLQSSQSALYAALTPPSDPRLPSGQHTHRASASCASSSSCSTVSSLVFSSSCWPYQLYDLRRFLNGVAKTPVLPPFPYDDMASTRRRSVPSTPRVISPSPVLSDHLGVDSQNSQNSQTGQTDEPVYNGPMTRSARKRLATPQPVEEESTDDETSARGDGRSSKTNKDGTNPDSSDGGDGGDGIDGSDSGPDARHTRTRSRSPLAGRSAKLRAQKAELDAVQTKDRLRPPPMNGVASTGSGSGSGSGWWHDLSRSPSPLGLIPIHERWRAFVHKHEVPRKVLHVSIGFLVMWLYASGTQTRSVCPYLMGLLIPIASTDLLRHRYAPFNRLYVRVLGALMRESEYDGYNGVIYYLLGAWTVLYALPKDVGVIGVMMLSWCDTAASTFGRLYGRYTPQLRRGKSLAGSAAAFVVGVATAALFWGWFTKTVGPMPGDEDFMFQGTLSLPSRVVSYLGLDPAKTTVGGGFALGVVSVVSGLVASASEFVDIFGCDDNLTIPVLSGFGIWAFLKVFG